MFHQFRKLEAPTPSTTTRTTAAVLVVTSLKTFRRDCWEQNGDFMGGEGSLLLLLSPPPDLGANLVLFLFVLLFRLVFPLYVTITLPILQTILSSSSQPGTVTALDIQLADTPGDGPQVILGGGSSRAAG